MLWVQWFVALSASPLKEVMGMAFCKSLLLRELLVAYTCALTEEFFTWSGVGFGRKDILIMGLV